MDVQRRRLRHEPLEARMLLSVSYPDFSDASGLNLLGDAAITRPPTFSD